MVCCFSDGRNGQDDQSTGEIPDSSTSQDPLPVTIANVKQEPQDAEECELEAGKGLRIDEVPVIDDFSIEKLPDGLQEVHKAWAASFDLPMPRVSSTPNKIDFVNLIEVPTKCLIKFSKQLEPFKQLDAEDQVELLKSSITEVMMMHAACSYNISKNTWTVKNQEQTTQDVEPAGLFTDTTEEMKECFRMSSQFAKSLRALVQGDFLLIKGLVVLALFSTDRPRIKDKDKAEKMQEYYATALHKYIQDKYAGDSSLFGNLMGHLVMIRNIEEVHNKMLMQMDVTELRPLIIELFDLSK